MNNNELFFYYLGIYRGRMENLEYDIDCAYLNFINDVYNIFSGNGKLHQNYLDLIIEETINQDGDVLIENTEEIIDNVVEYYLNKMKT